MIRPVVPADSPVLVALSGSSGLFRPEELDAVQGCWTSTTPQTPLTGTEPRIVERVVDRESSSTGSEGRGKRVRTGRPSNAAGEEPTEGL